MFRSHHRTQDQIHPLPGYKFFDYPWSHIRFHSFIPYPLNPVETKTGTVYVEGRKTGGRVRRLYHSNETTNVPENLPVHPQFTL